MTTQVRRVTALTTALAAVLGGLAVNVQAYYPNTGLPSGDPYTGSSSGPALAWVPPDADYYRQPPRYYPQPYPPQYREAPAPSGYRPGYNPPFDPRQLQAELASSRVELQRTTERLVATQALLQQAREALALNYSEHQEQRAGQADQAAQLSAAAAEAAAAQARIVSLTDELETVRTKIEQQQAQLAELTSLKSEYAQESATLQQLRAKTVRLDEEKATADSQYQSCQEQLAVQKVDLNTVHVDRAKDKQSLTEALAERGQLQAEVKNLTAELQARQDALARAEASTLSTAEQRDALKAQLAALETSVRESETTQEKEAVAKSTALTEQLEKTKATLDAELAAKTAMQQALADATTTRERLLGQLDSLNARLASTSNQEQQAQGELQQQLQACNERLAAAKTAITASTEAASVTPSVQPDDKPVTPQAVELAALESATVQAVSADRDADGVPDSKDLCLDSLAGVTVDATGCVADAPIALEGVNFRYDSDALTNPSRAVLDQVARILLEQPTLKVEIAGHSDTQGNAAYNLWLSEQRAKSVMTYLVTQGVPAERLSAHGYGGSQPIADNTTREGLARNRRVELRKQP